MKFLSKKKCTDKAIFMTVCCGMWNVTVGILILYVNLSGIWVVCVIVW